MRTDQAVNWGWDRLVDLGLLTMAGIRGVTRLGRFLTRWR